MIAAKRCSHGGRGPVRSEREKEEKAASRRFGALCWRDVDEDEQGDGRATGEEKSGQSGSRAGVG